MGHPGAGNRADIGYRDTAGSLHELWRDAQGATGTTNLTQNAGAPAATGSPYGYVNTNRSQTILLFRDSAGTVRSLYWTTGAVGSDNLSGTAGAPAAAGDPVGYYHAALDTHHVIYRLPSGHFQELWWTGDDTVQGGGDLTASAAAPVSAGSPSAFVDGSGVHLVVYRSGDGAVRDLYWTTGAVVGEDLSGTAGTPGAAGDPVAYYTAHDDTHQVAYIGQDGHLWELYWPGVTTVVGWNLSLPSGAPAGTGTPAAYYSAGTNTKHVFYRSGDGQLHEIWWVPGGGTPAHVNLTTAYGLPAAADDPAAFTVEGPNTQHVVFRGTDGHIYEVLW